ncbi:MAG: TolC family protein [Acidobacteria bacterium]|nr:TolC family protein [Acidobacteriota bacterium]
MPELRGDHKAIQLANILPEPMPGLGFVHATRNPVPRNYDAHSAFRTLFRVAVALLVAVLGSAQEYTPNGDSHLRLYVEEALARNPAARQSFARYRASLQRLPQVSSLPDPMLGFAQYLRTPETRVGPQTTMLTLSQQFPLFGKLSDKEKIAAKEAAMVREHYEAQRSEIVRQVKLAYYSLSYVDRAIAVTEEDLELLRHFEVLAQARYQQGVGLQQAVVKLQTEITRDLNRLEELRSRRVDAEAILNTLMDRPARSPLATVTLSSRPPAPIDYDALYEIARQHRPEVQSALLQIERDEKRVQLARRSYWPDITVGAGFTNVLGRSDAAGILSPPEQNGKNIYNVTAGINIPIRRRKYDAAVLEATEDQIASREGYRNVLNSVETSIRAVGFRIRTLEDQIALFEKTLLPQADQALRSTEAAYSTGTVGVLDLLDSERVLLEIRLGLQQLSSDYMKSLAEMERAIGAPFPEVQP